MDHLPRPFGIELTEEDEVSYVSSNDYLGVPFLEYVKTNEVYQVAADMVDAEAMSLYESKQEISELERFLQTWLFFGLLGGMLGTIFDQDDFVRATHSKAVISTKKLLGKLKHWISDPNLDQKRLTHTYQCLQMTLIALIATPKVFDIKLNISVAATAEVITTALLLAAKAKDISPEISVQINAVQPNSWYIALSHLRHLYDLLTRFCTEESTEGGQKRPYLWLDTLCCPVDPGDKLLALAKMPEVYPEASQVLVLDSSLTEIDYKPLQLIEVMSRVFSSGWIFRLWTLNEANLASKLCVQFRDGITELGQVLSELYAMTEPETYHFTGELVNGYGKLRIKLSKQANGELWYVTEALRYREVSESSDEPICVAALLRMAVDVITGEEKVRLSSNHKDRMRLGDERMARLWETCAQGYPKIPKSLIYHVGNRLTRHGLRWAPSTLLYINNTAWFFCSTETDLALPSANGLILSSAACSISVPERVDSILGRPSAAASSILDLLKYDEHRWLRIFSTSEQKKSPSVCDHMALYDIITKAGRGVEFEILKEHPGNLSQDSFVRMN